MRHDNRGSMPTQRFTSRLASTAAAALLVVTTAAPGLAALGDCSQPATNGASPVATDCLVILQTAVFANDCAGFDPCVCAPKGSLPVAATDALICLQIATGAGGVLDCPCGSSTSTSSSSTSTTLVGGSCPGRADVTVFAKITGEECVTNADCTVGVCDTNVAHCATPTDLDTGWTGIAHNADVNDQVMIASNIACPNPFQPGVAEPCGVCDVAGIDPAPRNCRCSTDNRTVCTNKFQFDTESCGVAVTCSVDADCKVCNVTTSQACNLDADCPAGERCLNGARQPSCVNNQCVGTCDCYFGPPLPLSAGNTPACVVNRFFEDFSGTTNVDTGAGSVSAELRAIVYLGELTTVPCPVCGGVCSAPPAKVGVSCVTDVGCDVDGGDGACALDDVANDGIRNGNCLFGDDAGNSCDVNAVNETFPAPTGGGHSLDCLPSVGKNVSGSGLVIQLEQTTGQAQPLASGVECGFSFAPELCPCGLCSLSPTTTCTSNGDCADLGLGLCARRAQGDPRPNQCDINGCNDTGDGINGLCATGPVNSFCDGVLRSDGEPFVGCLTNADCENTDCGIVSCGACALQRLRPCFLDPIVAAGLADPEFPVGAATFCVPPTANVGINSVAGLPGPARITNQLRSVLFCDSDPGSVYTPGVGGCP